MDAQHVERRDPLGDADDQRDAGVGGLEHRVRRERRPGTKMHAALAPVSRTASATVSNTGTRPSRAVWPPLPGVTPATMFVP